MTDNTQYVQTDGIALMKYAFMNHCSDIHFNTNQPVVVRLHGDIRPIVKTLCTPQDMETLLRTILNEKQMAELEEKGEVDFPYAIENLVRFRGNAYQDKDGYGISFRVLPKDIPDMDSLGLPLVLKNMLHKEKGIILVTGPTGSGKSTSLASMIDYVNRNMAKKIITLEEPIEYEYANKLSRINQRQVGLHTETFASGLRACLRQDPDVILVGEIRDLETLTTAITAGETGHLVLATLHTVSAITTVERVIDMYPHEQQNQIRSQLSMNLLGVLAQRLLRLKDGSGRVGAFEVLVNNFATKNLIRESKLHQLESVMQSHRAIGMRTMEDSLQELYQGGYVTKEEVMKHLVKEENVI